MVDSAGWDGPGWQAWRVDCENSWPFSFPKDMNWTYLVLTVFSLWLAIIFGVAAEAMRRERWLILPWIPATISLACVLTAVYGSQHIAG